MEAKQIIEALGADAVAEALGVTLSAVAEQRRQGKLPAAWYVRLRDLGAARGVSVPEGAFRWKSKGALE